MILKALFKTFIFYLYFRFYIKKLVAIWEHEICFSFFVFKLKNELPFG